MFLSKNQKQNQARNHARRFDLSKSKTFPVFKKGNIAALNTETNLINNNQLKSFQLYLKQCLKKRVKFWITSSSQINLTKKSKDVRLGRGKASIKYQAVVLKNNSTLFEVQNKQLMSSLFEKIKARFAIDISRVSRKERWFL